MNASETAPTNDARLTRITEASALKNASMSQKIRLARFKAVLPATG